MWLAFSGLRWRVKESVEVLGTTGREPRCTTLRSMAGEMHLDAPPSGFQAWTYAVVETGTAQRSWTGDVMRPLLGAGLGEIAGAQAGKTEDQPAQGSLQDPSPSAQVLA
ncbi:hypothetical protein GGTG_13673 [Gaeumannomyces tritici R3-111a-1]|uniref:Uncharacterized protein n=1 Tax=Gaeumannomyces tritici (strain R3-111a-1) TaxID=644352 RepID=J3PJI9_GAET3|nr:hypothetical protein GGTG_13673 [Gaeumannomyces tritici R3-111a-1]EJT68754.1 hypothetical protein GGTG_13673 [Gaeumannomyces tritici R3-111a-1]